MRRDLRLFYLFRLLATSYLWQPIFVSFQFSRGLDFGDVMLLGGLYSVVVMLVEIPTGALADRLGRRTSMMLGSLMMVGSCLFAYFFATDLPTFMVSEVLAALSLSLCSGADSAYLFDLLTVNNVGHEYGQRESAASAWHQAGTAVAFASGGALAMYDLALPYLISAGVAFAAFLVAFAMREDRSLLAPPSTLRVPARDAWRSWLRLMRRAGHDLVSNGRLTWLIGYSAVVFVLLKATIYVYQPYLDDYGLNYAERGLLFAGVYLVASLVAQQSYRLRRLVGDEILLWALLGGLAVSFGLMVSLDGPVVLGLLGVQAVANGLYSPLVKPLLNREITDSSRRATILSVESIARRGVMGIFAPIAGLGSASTAIGLCGVLGGLGLAVLATFAVRSPRLRATPTPTPE